MKMEAQDEPVSVYEGQAVIYGDAEGAAGCEGQRATS